MQGYGYSRDHGCPPELSGEREPPTTERANNSRRAVAIINYMAHELLGFVVIFRVLPQMMASHIEGTHVCIQITTRYLSAHPRGVSTIPRCTATETLCIWMDSDGAVDVAPHKACRGGCIQRNVGATWPACPLSIMARSIRRATQARIALSSGEIELNSAVSGISAGIGVRNALREGMLPPMSPWNVKHFSNEELCLEHPCQSYGMEVQRVPRTDNSSARLSPSEMGEALQRMERRIAEEWAVHLQIQ